MSTSSTENRGLLVGVSDYPGHNNDLPAVEADIRKMAELLSVESTPDAFPVFTDADAVRSAIEDALNEFVDQSTSADLAVLYFAGHGTVREGTHFFVPYDYTNNDGLRLSTIRSAVDRSEAEATILFLDICYSGGIVGRGDASSIEETTEKLDRELQRLSGSGKAILAACTGDQLAGEDELLGHGVFTNYVLSGLKGAAAVRGCVTANSLHDYVVDKLERYPQTPVYHTNATGSLTLVHRESSVSPAGDRDETPESGNRRVDGSGDYMLLDGEIYRATSIRHSSGEGTVTIELTSDSGALDSHIERISAGPTTRRGTSRAQKVELAYDNRAAIIRITDADLERGSEGRHWTLTAEFQQERRSSRRHFGNISANGETYTAADIAELRARSFLLGETPDIQRTTRSLLGLTGDLGPDSSAPLRNFLAERPQPSEDDLRRIRLRLLLQLIDLNIVDRVHELALGPLTDGGLEVTLRGELDSRYANREPDVVAVTGTVAPPD